MMVAKEQTAEQKLLQMIESSSAASAASPSAKEGKFSSQFNILKLIKSLNKILFLVLLGSAAVLAYQIYSGVGLLNQNVSFSVEKNSKGAKGVSMLIPNVQGVSFYLAGVTKRNIFEPFEEVRPKQTVSVSEENKKIISKTSHLKLVGISWLDKIETASVMLEDTDKQMTYFLQEGEKVGDIVVKTIYADSAVLGYENEEIIIRYDKS